jgi:serine/threonine protein kinase
MDEGHTVKLTPGAAPAAENTSAPTVQSPSARAVDKPPSSSAPPKVAGYELLHVIGRGGMGIVWQAHEQRFDRQVALKVHASAASSEEVAQIWSEAHLAAKIGDPGIVRVHDVGYTLEGHPYYAMELVEGTELSARIAEGPMAPQRALVIAADIARAAGAAHAHGIVHRDLKPKNVIVDAGGRARVLDFGIAVNARSGKDLFAGLMCGSPPYMAPEQITGTTVSPQTDVHAVGVILFEMLTGERPFSAESQDALLIKIATEPPPAPRSLDRQIHEDVEQIILRCLDKDPARRFANGRALHEALSAVIEGRPLEHVAPRSSAYLPRVKSSRPPENRPKREDATKHFKWSWTLKTPPEKLWPYVSNTDRLNRAFGLSPVDFTDEPREEGGGTTRTGRMSALGMAIEWQEFPFEWVKNREHSVFRWYRSGPIAALWNKVTLAPSDEEGTLLTHEIWLLPRGLLGQVASFIEVSQKASRGIDKSYRHLDEVLSSGRHEDPFEAPHAARDEDKRHVSDVVGKLSSELGFRRELADRFATHVLETPSIALSRMRPYELADAWQEDRAEVLDLMLHAAGARLLEPSWDTICPKCMLAHDSVSTLARVTREGHCTACASSYERDLSESVELVFRPHPRVRTTERVTYCAGAPALRPHVLVQQVLYAGESRTITVDIPRGTYRVTGTGVVTPWELTASAAGFESQVEAIVGERAQGRPQIVRAGEITLTLINDSDFEQTIRVEIPGAREDGVSGASAMTHPTFRELFGQDLLAYGQHLSVSHMAFVFASVGNREEVFEKLGDNGAIAAFGKLDEAFSKVIVAEHGSMVPASLDLLVGAFASGTRAMRAALALKKAIAGAKLADSVQIACHEGRCIALTRGDKAEFFGQTLHRGASLLLDTPPGTIALSTSMSTDRAVAAVVHEADMSIHMARAMTGPYQGRPIAIVTDDAAPVSLSPQRVANAG